MSKLRFEFEWVDPEGVQVRELSATWSSLKIIAGDSVVTRAHDDRAKTVRDFIYVPLYPIAEWLTTNWWFLINEFRNREKQVDPGFHQRHELNAGRQGYALPNLSFYCSGSETNLVWDSFKPQWTRIEFLSRGTTWMATSDFRDICADFIDGVVRRLAMNEIEDTFLQREWDAIQATTMDQEELQFCETVAAMGLDPYDLEQSKSDEIINWADGLGELLPETVQIANPSMLFEQSSAIVQAVEESRTNGLRLNALKDYTREFTLGNAGISPWRVGYDWARDLRYQIGLGGQPIPRMSDLAAALGEDESALNQATQPVKSLSKTPMIDGLITGKQDHTKYFALRQFNERGRRFSFCRAISEVLAHPWSNALITDSYSERQKCNRAFAAEFLAPSNSLKDNVTHEIVDDEEIDDLADTFGVSPWVIKHQIENHQIAQLAETAFA